MIPVLTTSAMREIDRKTIGSNTATGYSYMLKAGMGLFLAARELSPDPSAGEIAVVCGKGNNGGDGYVVARLLLEAGYRVTCFSLCPVEGLTGEARMAFDEYAARKGNFLVLDDTAYLSNLSHYRLIIDAMLGTGAAGPPRGLCASAIEAINASGLPVLAVDTPSGMDNDTGEIHSPCIRATVTVTLGYPKVGHYFYPGREYAGRLIVHDLGYPDEIVNESAPLLYYPVREQIAACLPRRRAAGSKFDHGLALLVCGSRGMAGSAALAAAAAMRSGCGMTHLASPESLIPVLAVKLTETVLHPLPETADGAVAMAAAGKITELSKSMHALCIGPGLSHGNETQGLCRSVVAQSTLPAVLDADGLNAFKDHARELSNHGGPLVITPHRGEWQRLFGELPFEPIALVQRLKEVAAQYRMTVLLKGSPTICATEKGTAWVLPFGNSALAKAGSGDVLSGIIVSLLAQGATAEQAAILGAWLHGEAGRIASEGMGEYSVVASDIVVNIHKAILHLLKKLQGDKQTDCGMRIN